MAVVVYQSSDTSAPVLNGTAGSMVTLLEVCLSTGYGSKSALGWSVAKNAAGQKVAVRSQDAASAGHYLFLDDTGSGPGGARFAIGHGVLNSGWGGFDGSGDEIVTAGTEFPTTTQVSWGSEWAKSSTLDTTARDWVLIGDERTFYFFCAYQGASFDYSAAFPRVPGHMFGDYEAYHPVTNINTLISANHISQNYVSNSQGSRWQLGMYSASGFVVAGYAANQTDLSGSTPYYNMRPKYTVNSSNRGWGSDPEYPPNPLPGSSNALMDRVEIAVGDPQTTGIHGLMRGIVAPIHDDTYTHGQIITGVPGFESRNFMVIRFNSFGANGGNILIDTTGPW